MDDSGPTLEETEDEEEEEPADRTGFNPILHRALLSAAPSSPVPVPLEPPSQPQPPSGGGGASEGVNGKIPAEEAGPGKRKRA